MCAESSGSSEIAIRWERRAVNEAAALPARDRERIVGAVEGLRDDPLQGLIMSADWKGFRRLRVGRYRVIYAFDGRELLVSVIRIGHRSGVYR
jgi:mRNA interferase RelE/StbE